MATTLFFKFVISYVKDVIKIYFLIIFKMIEYNVTTSSSNEFNIFSCEAHFYMQEFPQKFNRV